MDTSPEKLTKSTPTDASMRVRIGYYICHLDLVPIQVSLPLCHWWYSHGDRRETCIDPYPGFGYDVYENALMSLLGLSDDDVDAA